MVYWAKVPLITLGTHFSRLPQHLRAQGSGWVEEAGLWPASPFPVSQAHPTSHSCRKGRGQAGSGAEGAQNTCVVPSVGLLPGSRGARQRARLLFCFCCFTSPGKCW